jgi:hemolysin activation/secretion protein
MRLSFNFEYFPRVTGKANKSGGVLVFMMMKYSLGRQVSLNFRVFCLFLLVPGSALWSSISIASETSSPAREMSEEATETPEGEKLAFDILDIQIEGNTVLPRIVVEKIIYPFMGENKTIDDLETARRMLEQQYKERGFVTVFVDIPEQDVKDGVVRLKVTEGKVGRLRIKDSRYYSLGRIREAVPSLSEGSVPNFPVVQKEMASLNSSAGLRVSPVLRAGTTPGTVDVDLNVKDQSPLYASVELNDRFSPNTTRFRVIGTLRYDNLWQRGHSVNFQYQTSPENLDEVQVFAGNYLMGLGSSGLKLAVYGVHADSNVAVLGTTNVIGKGDIVGARLILPLTGLDTYYHSLTLGFDYKDFGQAVRMGTGRLTTPITYFPISLQYNGTQQDRNGTTQFGLGVNFSTRALSERQIECLPGYIADQFECKRHGAQADFIYLRSDLHHLHTLPKDFVLSGRISGQIANQPLINNEQFSAGGFETVRGYPESQLLGDNGFQGSVNLQTPRLPGDLIDWRLLAFVDGAYTNNYRRLDTDLSYSILSTGVGMRLKTQRGYGSFSGISGALDFAWPLRNFRNATTNIQTGDMRMHFRLLLEM